MPPIVNGTAGTGVEDPAHLPAFNQRVSGERQRVDGIGRQVVRELERAGAAVVFDVVRIQDVRPAFLRPVPGADVTCSCE